MKYTLIFYTKDMIGGGCSGEIVVTLKGTTISSGKRYYMYAEKNELLTYQKSSENQPVRTTIPRGSILKFEGIEFEYDTITEMAINFHNHIFLNVEDIWHLDRVEILSENGLNYIFDFSDKEIGSNSTISVSPKFTENPCVNFSIVKSETNDQKEKAYKSFLSKDTYACSIALNGIISVETILKDNVDFFLSKIDVDKYLNGKKPVINSEVFDSTEFLNRAEINKLITSYISDQKKYFIVFGGIINYENKDYIQSKIKELGGQKITTIKDFSQSKCWGIIIEKNDENSLHIVNELIGGNKDKAIISLSSSPKPLITQGSPNFELEIMAEELKSKDDAKFKNQLDNEIKNYKLRAENSIKYFIPNPNHGYLSYVKEIKKTFPTTVDLQSVNIIVADSEEHGEEVTRMIGGAAGFAQQSNIFYLDSLSNIEKAGVFHSQNTSSLFDEYNKIVDDILKIAEELEKLKLKDEKTNLIIKLYLELNFRQILTSRRLYLAIGFDIAQQKKWINTTLLNMSFCYDIYGFLRDPLPLPNTSFALSKFSPEEMENLKKLLGWDFPEIQRIDPQKPDYKSLSFTQEKISAFKKKLEEVATEQAKNLSAKLVPNNDKPFSVFLSEIGIDVLDKSFINDLYEYVQKNSTIIKAKENLKQDLKKYSNILVISAAGNEYESAMSDFNDPRLSENDISDIEEIINVGAFDINHNETANFSPAGKDVLICAPGVGIPIKELKPIDDKAYSETPYIFSPENARFLENDNGTSFAAPFVASVVANMIAVNPKLTPEDIRMIFRSEKNVELSNDDSNRVCRLLNPEKAIKIAKTFNSQGRILEERIKKIEPLFNVFTFSEADDQKFVAWFARVQLAKNYQGIITALIKALGDSDSSVKTQAASALVQLGKESPDVIAALIKALGDSGVRTEAAKALGNLKQASPDVIDALINAFLVGGDYNCSGDYNYKRQAASALVQLGKESPHAIAALIKALGDEYYLVRTEAASALGNLKQASSDVIATLIKALGDSQSREVRREVASALGNLKQASSDVIAALIKALGDNEWQVRTQAASALVQLGKESPDVIAALIKALGDESKYVKAQAASVLGNLKQASSDVIASLIKALEDSDSDVRTQAASALVQLGKESPDVIAVLIKALEDWDLYVRTQAASALGNLKQASSDVIDALIKALGDSQSREVRREVASALGNLKQASTDVIDALIKALGDKDKDVRTQAASALVQLGKESPDVIAALINAIKALGYGNYNVRTQAASALGNLKKASPDVIAAALINALGDTTRYGSVNVRTQATFALVQLGKESPDIIATLIKALGGSSNDPYGQVRKEAASALGNLKQASPDVIVALIKALGDSSNNYFGKVRTQAASALGNLKQASTDVIDALIKALGDSDSDVRTQAASALVQLGKESPDVIAALIKALGDESKYVKAHPKALAASVLGNLKQASSDVIAALIKALGDKSEYVRTQAVSTLVQLGQESPNVIAALIKALGDESEYVKPQAASALGNLKQALPDVIAALIKALEDSSNDPFGKVRTQAASALGNLKQASSDVIDALIKALGNSQSSRGEFRKEAASALGNLKQASPDVIDALIKALGDWDSDVRTQATSALVQLGKESPDVIAALIKALGDESEYVKVQAASALGNLKQASPDVIAALIKALGDSKSSQVRTQAASALGNLKQASPDVIAALIKALGDESKYVKAQAASALGNLGEKLNQQIDNLFESFKKRDTVPLSIENQNNNRYQASNPVNFWKAENHKPSQVPAFGVGMTGENSSFTTIHATTTTTTTAGLTVNSPMGSSSVVAMTKSDEGNSVLALKKESLKTRKKDIKTEKQKLLSYQSGDIQKGESKVPTLFNVSGASATSQAVISQTLNTATINSSINAATVIEEDENQVLGNSLKNQT